MIIRFGLDDKRETLLINSTGEIFQLRKGEQTFIVKNTKIWADAEEWASENSERYLNSIPYEITEDLKSVFYILLANGLLESVHSLVEGSKKSLALFTLEDGLLVPFSVCYDTMTYKGVVADNFSDLGTEPTLWFKNNDGVVVPCKKKITDKEELTIISDCLTSLADAIPIDDIENVVSKSSVSISLNSFKDDASLYLHSKCADCTNKACFNEVCPIEDCSSKVCFKKTALFSVTEPVVTEPVVSEPANVELVAVADTKTKFCLTRNNACSIQ